MFRCGLSWLTSSSGLCLGGGAERRSRTGVGVELVDAELVRVKLGEAQLASGSQLAKVSQRRPKLVEVVPEC